MSKRYIDADALKEKKVYSAERHECVVPVAEIDWLPTADVVEVVRCKDCRHSEICPLSPAEFLTCNKTDLIVGENHYCSYGERREEMRDRLIELIGDKPFTDEYQSYNSWEWAEHFADHLLANGVIVPPVKVGQTVFIIDEGDECSKPYVLDVVITAYGYDVSGFWATLNLPLGLKLSAHFGERMFGKTVFLTREEAEKALERSKK